jgi:asparagine synthase (glutamine-hydrolysing)
MCGIYGQINGSPAVAECGLSLSHRGPDDAGTQDFQIPGTSQWVTLSHRRLSIIDLSTAGHQPMANEDETVWIIFNGEIYNFLELRPQLLAAGHQFRSKTDTEVILHGYEQWGDEVVKKLRGMFAFAIWDGRRRRMLLARDRIGKKPLFFYCDDHRLFFGSEIKSILATGEVPAELDPVSLHDYLTYLFFPAPRTAFTGIVKLPPATCMAVNTLPGGRLETKQWSYWDPVEAAAAVGEISPKDAVERTRTVLDEAVRIRLISDVPLGIFLSGGIDSSTITALASRHSLEPVQTFSIGFRDSKFYDELPYANLVAQAFHTDHHVLEPNPDCAMLLTKVVRHFDEPFGNPTAILEYILTKLMREHVTVALSGDGGDELFGGYQRYAGARLAGYYQHLPRFITQGLVSKLSMLMRDDTNGRHGFRRLREFAQSAWLPLEDMYLSWIGYFSEAEKHELYTPAFAAQVQGRDSGDFLRARFRQGAQLDPLNRLGYVDLASFLCCNCLEYGDRMSMANSLEVRCPFSDQELVEFALGLPATMKLRGLHTKWIVKQAMRGILPAEILHRKKMGFSPPLPKWINRELKPLLARLLDPATLERRGIFRADSVARLLRDHAEQRRDNSMQIWALLMIEVWQRMYLDGESEPLVRESLLAASAGSELQYEHSR